MATYETADHKDAERRAIDAYLSTVVGKWEVESLPKFYPLDYAIKQRKTIRGWIEVKVRNNGRGAYPTQVVPVPKWLAMQQHSLIAPVLLLVQWTDALGGVRVDEHLRPSHISPGLRTDRDNDMDAQPHVHIPTEEFKIYDPLRD